MDKNYEYQVPEEMMALLDEDIYKDNFAHYRKNIVTKIAYLIGVPNENLENPKSFAVEELEGLRNNETATIIRSLCTLRTQFFQNYGYIYNARKYDGKRVEELGNYLNIDSIKYLRSKNMEVANVSDKIAPAANISYINQYIQDSIDKIKDIIPDWIKFKYIRPLFLMPGGYSGKNGSFLKKNPGKIINNIIEESKLYASQKSGYPYQTHITWPHDFRETDGNILYNDLKFLKMLYGANGDKFAAEKYVIDAKIESKEDIYKFLNEARNIIVYVDCENVDPYAFAATLTNLDEDNLSKINVINLYDDVNTSTAWDYICDVIDIPVEHYEVDRLLKNKSLVDMTMALDVSKEYYENDIDSAILVSSDSDFWTVIEKLDKVNFYVLNEKYKTSPVTIDTLDRHGISHCYMSDFAQDVIQNFKAEVLYLGLENRIREFNETGTFIPMNVDELLTELFGEAGIKGDESQLEKEKEVFYNKHIKNGFAIKPVTENGEKRLKIELKRK